MKNLLFIIPDYLGPVTGANKRAKIISSHLSNSWKVSIINRKTIIMMVNNKVHSEKKTTFLNILVLLVTTKFSFWFCDYIKWSLFPMPNLVFTLHDMKEWTDFGRGGIIKKISLYIVAKKSKYLITVSQDQKKLIKQHLGLQSYIYPNAVSQKWLEYLSTDLRVSTIEDDKYIIYVSNFTKHKNHLDLINNNSLLNRYKLVLVGSAIDECGLSIKNDILNNPNVKVYENISESKLRDLVYGSSFVVFPSLYEGYGMPILESIALNKRVLISDKLILSHFDDCELVKRVSFAKGVSKKDIIWAENSIVYDKSNIEYLIRWNEISKKINNLLVS